MERKRETIINYILILLAVVYVIFVIAYDYYRINVYLDTVERAGDKAGYAVVSMLVYVCYNILILGGGTSSLAIALLVSTKRLAKNNGKPKKRVLIFTLICKVIACGLMIYGACMVFSLVYADWVMKVVYLFMPMAYFCAIIYSIVFFKKIAA